MNEDRPLHDRVREAFEALSLHTGPTRKEKRRKRWHILEITNECYECGRNEYRLVWPWTVTYDDVPVLFVNSWGRHDWAEPDEWRKTDD